MKSYKDVHSRNIDIAVLLCILAPIAAGYFTYSELPEKVASHWNMRGEVNGWMHKNYMVLGFTQAIQIFLYGLMIGLRWLVIQVSGGKKQNDNPAMQMFKNRETALNIALVDKIMVLTIGFIGSIHLFILMHALYNISLAVVTYILLPVLLVIILIFIIFSTRAMQRLTGEMAEAGVLSKELLEESKRYWKWGIFYWNPEDKSIFIQKRLGGAGVTLNFAHGMSWFIMILLLLPALSLLFLIVFLH